MYVDESSFWILLERAYFGDSRQFHRVQHPLARSISFKVLAARASTKHISESSKDSSIPISKARLSFLTKTEGNKSKIILIHVSRQVCCVFQGMCTEPLIISMDRRQLVKEFLETITKVFGGAMMLAFWLLREVDIQDCVSRNS